MVAASTYAASALHTAVYYCNNINSMGIHLSEDIFAGFNWVLRGGRSSQLDYIQAGKVSFMYIVLFTLQLLLSHEALLDLSMCFSI
jgi:hypothetical protein